MKFALGWCGITSIVIICVAVLPGMRVDWSFGVFAGVASLLAVVNVVLGWTLTGLDVPLEIYTWGPIALICNTLALLTTDRLMGRFEIDGFWPAALAAAAISVADLVIEGLSRSFRSSLAQSEERRKTGWNPP